MFANKLSSEVRECGEMVTTNGTQQCGRGGTTKGSVMINSELLAKFMEAY